MIEPSTTAVITMEMQRGICGDHATITMLADAVADQGIAANTRRLLEAARSHGMPIMHCTFSLPADRTGIDLSLPLMRAAAEDPAYLLRGTEPCELLAELGPEPGDLIVDRCTGVSPFIGTSLDDELGSRGVDTVVVSGVSLNIGIIGTVIEAVNLGYRVVVARDAVVGVPVEYGEQVLRNALGGLAKVRTVDEIVESLADS